MSGMLPNFVIVGAQKSGTTSMYHYLRDHPDVFMAPAKELHYFDRHIGQDLEWYKNKFAGATTQSVIGEATPNYMYFEHAAERMAEVIPQARLVAILRNPVSRAYSHYWHSRSRGREKLEFVDAISAEPERLKSTDLQVRQWYSYVDRGRYLYQLERICQNYPRESVKVLIFEEMCSQPLEALRSVCQFLDVDDEFVPPDLGVAYNRRVQARSTKLRAITRRIAPLHRVIDPINTSSSTYPPMDADTRVRLREIFKADNAALADWLGRDLFIWDK